MSGLPRASSCCSALCDSAAAAAACLACSSARSALILFSSFSSSASSSCRYSRPECVSHCQHQAWCQQEVSQGTGEAHAPAQARETRNAAEQETCLPRPWCLRHYTTESSCQQQASHMRTVHAGARYRHGRSDSKHIHSQEARNLAADTRSLHKAAGRGASCGTCRSCSQSGRPAAAPASLMCNTLDPTR